MEKTPSYLVIWKHFDKNSTTAYHLNANNDISLPYLIEGEEIQLFEQKQPLELNPLHLVKGLLVGYFDQPPKVDTDFAKKKTLSIVEEHLSAFKASSPEQFILDISNYLRDAHGSEVSLQSLMAGAELIPSSVALKYDACFDLIHCIDDELLDDKIAAVQKLKLLLSKIEVKKLNPLLMEDYSKMIEIANEY